MRSIPLILVVAALGAGCGATPPQAPLPMAKKLDTSTATISTACGEADQVTAFPGDHVRQLSALDAAAAAGARELASVNARNPDWIYQGETVAEIVDDSIAYLRRCGLTRSALLLVRRTSSR